MGETKRAGVYTRMSKSKGEAKIEQQAAMGEALAEANGYEVTKTYVDDGVSAYTFKDRPGWADLLADIEAGRIDIVLAQSEDRLTRQPMEKETLALLCATKGVRWHTTNDGLIDPATSDGQFQSGLRALLARQESARKSERMKQSNAARLAKGQPLTNGARPFGYEADKVTVRESEAAMLRAAYEAWNAGTAGLYAIAKDWNAQGVTTVLGGAWNTTNVRTLLCRARNAGLVERRDGIVPGVRGQWQPIVSEEVYRAALARMAAQPKSTRSREPQTLLNAIARCTCGMTMRPSGPRDGRKYRCTAMDQMTGERKGHTSIREKDLDPVVEAAMVSALFLGSVRDDSPQVSSLSALYATLSDVRAKVARLVDMASEGVLTGAEVSPKIAALRAEEAEVQARIDALAAQNASAAMVAELRGALFAGERVDLQEAASVKATVRDRFQALPLDAKRALIRASLDIVVGPGRSIERVEVHARG